VLYSKALQTDKGNPSCLLHTSRTKLEAISVQVPANKSEQGSIADRLNDLLAECRRLERIALQQLTALADLKQSLLQIAFSVELKAVKEASTATLKEDEVALT
jgi:type I restriction enzyme S subunit